MTFQPAIWADEDKTSFRIPVKTISVNQGVYVLGVSVEGGSLSTHYQPPSGGRILTNHGADTAQATTSLTFVWNQPQTAAQIKAILDEITYTPTTAGATKRKLIFRLPRFRSRTSGTMSRPHPPRPSKTMKKDRPFSA